MDVAVIDGIPVTSPARTLIDLASVLPAEALEEVLDDALRRNLVSIARMRWRMDALAARGRRGMSMIGDLVAERADGGAIPQSILETRLAREINRSGLQPERQYHIRDRGRTVAVVDFAFPDARLAVEADGYKWHSGKSRWARDLARRNRVTALGWRVLHITWTEFHEDRAGVVERIGLALREPG